MKLGFFSMNTGYSIRPDRLARALEDRGFESFWVGEHSHIPAKFSSPYPGGGELPKAYSNMMDPFVSLMAAAGATSSLKLGTGVCLVLERDLLALAKEVATLDVLSGGRILLGVGVGWNREELANHLPDLAFNRRYGAMRERILALKQLWTEEVVTVMGNHVRLQDVVCLPKPVQRPHPPIIMGCWGEVGKRHTIEYCEGFGPVDASMRPTKEKLAEFRQQAEDAGRDPATIEITIFSFGIPKLARLQAYREQGVGRVVLGTAHQELHEGDNALPFLDRFAPLVTELA